MDNTVKAEANGLAIASLVFGVLSVLSCWTIVLPIPQAALAISFSLLSRGNRKKSDMATAGLILGIIGAILGIICASVLIGWVISLLTNSPLMRFLQIMLENMALPGGGL